MKAHIVGERICSPSPDEMRFDITDSGAVLLLKLQFSHRKGKIMILNQANSELALPWLMISFLFLQSLGIRRGRMFHFARHTPREK